MRKKEWFYKAAACIASAALTLTALPVISASAATSVKGTSHVTQFGEYNIEVTVGVEDQKIRSLSVEGKNYAGNYVSDNKMRLERAAEGLEDAYLTNELNENYIESDIGDAGVLPDGKQYLILHFDVVNPTDKGIVLDVSSWNATFKVDYTSQDGNSESASCYTTFLTTDLSGYDESNLINAGETKSAVLLFEIPDSVTEVSDIVLHVTRDDTTYEIKL